MPPLAFTQVKYALAMFAMSAKLVPVWSVTIEPRLIGVPVAACPGLVPHAEVVVFAAALLAGVLRSRGGAGGGSRRRAART